MKPQLIKVSLVSLFLLIFLGSSQAQDEFKLDTLEYLELFEAILGLDPDYLKVKKVSSYNEDGDLVQVSTGDTIVSLKNIFVKSNMLDLLPQYNHLGEIIKSGYPLKEKILAKHPDALNLSDSNKIILPHAVRIENIGADILSLENLIISDLSIVNSGVTQLNLKWSEVQKFSVLSSFDRDYQFEYWEQLSERSDFQSVVAFKECEIEDLELRPLHLVQLNIWNSDIDSFVYRDGGKSHRDHLRFDMKDSRISAFKSIDVAYHSGEAVEVNMDIERCELNLIQTSQRWPQKNIKPNLSIAGLGKGLIRIDSSRIRSINEGVPMVLKTRCHQLNITSSSVQTPLVIYESEIQHQISTAENEFKLVGLINTTLPEETYNVNLAWYQLKEGLCVVSGLENTKDSSGNYLPSIELFDGYGSEVQDFHLFSALTSSYTNLYNTYKLRGDIESANPCYAELKRIQTNRWRFLYKRDRNFEAFFRWRLNQFLNIFTDYGTNPAKAVIRSIWVILLFSIFYLFFPSDWDISNRSEMLSRWKDLFNRNREKSLLSTFYFLLFTGFIHLLNALTLSLNAFTTLGFGDIPTHGAARYVTIVQGFIGWFLLTIFSVSLINQVLG